MGIIIGVHHHGRHSQQATLLPSAAALSLWSCRRPTALGEYASQMLPGSSAIRRSHRLATHVLPAPQNASFCFSVAGMGFCFAFLSNPLFPRVFVAAASHKPSLKALRYPAIFLQLVPDVH